jgi:hypothetical protein
MVKRCFDAEKGKVEHALALVVEDNTGEEFYFHSSPMRAAADRAHKRFTYGLKKRQADGAVRSNFR